MFLSPFTPPALFAQVPSPVITEPRDVRPLPGELDRIPVFNSNSPELVLSEGILLSTFSPRGKRQPTAHLNFPLDGRFDIFAHHVAKPAEPGDLRTLYLGILVYNPGTEPVTLEILTAASYLSQPDAPFVELPPIAENNQGEVYAGPGSRVMADILRGKRGSEFPETITIPPRGYRMLINAPIPVRPLEPPLNGRSLLMQLQGSDPVYVASLAQYAVQNPDGSESAPPLESWIKLLNRGQLATPRDRVPTPPDAETDTVIYGRVAGVALGSAWNAEIPELEIPRPGAAISYVLSSLPGGQLGTDQIQSAPLAVRYPDTAYRAHGNYGIRYALDLPLYNPTDEPKTVALTLETPLKTDGLSGGLQFFDELPDAVFFRGTVRFRYADAGGEMQNRYFHLVQKRGQQGTPLIQLEIEPQARRRVEFEFLYPPDATPPQVLTIQTLN
ncbi:DUF3370 domain-containing protein [Lyngbya sp. CCY1209]|uniref:DUF3370 domain-containing protein n=1 Tax=Lyngbya sp. CCY1209 TaxID=2886103 RepID=UPI002D212D75|nr:DUF3370 domain-containing protein [Lyngbya sp. CCY1209]MEB3887053.1 DUF3370 domain-containing protein [Lyngbya sp. CCY1209]